MTNSATAAAAKLTESSMIRWEGPIRNLRAAPGRPLFVIVAT
jgi:hypothetical protein